MTYSYHHFRIKPVAGVRITLHLRREFGNAHSATAVEVYIPPFHVPEGGESLTVQHRGTTYPLVQFSGRMVGRIPAELSPVVYGLLGEEWLRIFAFYTGYLVHGGPVRGGGPQLECCFVFNLTQNYMYNLKSVTDSLRGKIEEKLFA